MSVEVKRSVSQPFVCYSTLVTWIFQLLVVLNSLNEALTQFADDFEQGSVSLYIGCFTERTDLFKESIYSRKPQTCIEICEVKAYEYAILFGEKCFCSKILHEEDRQDDRLCNIRCPANKSQYCGGSGVHSYYSTAWNKELTIYNVKVINRTENSLIVQWQSANEQRMYVNAGVETTKTQIDNFLIKTNVLHTYSSFPVFPQPEFVVQKGQRFFELTDLHPGTLYNITIEALCDEEVCGSVSINGSTLVGLPNPEPKAPTIQERSEKTLTIEIGPIHNNNGPVNKLQIIVEKVDAVLRQDFDAQLLGSWEKSQETGLPFYITAEIDYDEMKNEPVTFTVGDNKMYGSYLNIPLREDSDTSKEDGKSSDIHISLGVVSSLDGVTKILYSHSGHEQHYNMFDDFEYSTFEKGQESVIALAVTCSIFGIFVILSAITYIYLRCIKFKQTNSLTYNQEMNEINN